MHLLDTLCIPLLHIDHNPLRRASLICLCSAAPPRRWISCSPDGIQPSTSTTSFLLIEKTILLMMGSIWFWLNYVLTHQCWIAFCICNQIDYYASMKIPALFRVFDPEVWFTEHCGIQLFLYPREYSSPHTSSRLQLSFIYDSSK